MPNQVSLCTLNNIAWCETICRAHGLPGELGPDLWIQPRRGPPYYSNAITRSRASEEALKAAIGRLKAALLDGFSIKDAYASVDLRSQGFRVLFEAEWVWLDPDHASTRHPANEKGENTDWFNVNSEAELLEWEAAWAAAGSPSETQVFPPALLKETSLAFLGARREGEIVAGAAANRSEGNVVGFSNFFSPASGRESFRAEAVARVAEFSPGAPVVGYERGDDLEGMLALGFRSVGKLTVWIWP